MKTLFTFLLATTFASSAFAYDEGRLTVTFASKSNVKVVIDGRSYTQQENTIVLNNIQPGNHSIKIYKARRNGNGRNNNRNELLYSTTVQVKPSYHVDIMVNRFGKALIDEKALRSNSRWDDDWNDDNSNYGNDNTYDRAMSQTEFNQFAQKIRSQWFSSGKMNIAKDGVARSYFTTSQIRELLQLFSSENDKLELAKLSYRNVVDQRSFYQLYDVFTFQSSKDELDRYIREYR